MAPHVLDHAESVRQLEPVQIRSDEFLVRLRGSLDVVPNERAHEPDENIVLDICGQRFERSHLDVLCPPKQGWSGAFNLMMLDVGVHGPSWCLQSWWRSKDADMLGKPSSTYFTLIHSLFAVHCDSSGQWSSL